MATCFVCSSRQNILRQEPDRENSTLCLAVVEELGLKLGCYGIFREKYVELKMLVNNRIQTLGKGQEELTFL